MAISKDMSEATEVTLPQVRAILKKAGLTPAKVSASTQVRGYTTVTHQGFKLRKETEFRSIVDSGERIKRHIPTGRVQMDLLLSSWHPDEEKATADLATAKQALTDAGYTVADSTPKQIVVSR